MGAPRCRAISVSIVGGLGFEIGPLEIPSFDFHFQRPPTRAIKITGRDEDQHWVGVGKRNERTNRQTRSARKVDRAGSLDQPGVGCHQGWRWG